MDALTSRKQQKINKISACAGMLYDRNKMAVLFSGFKFFTRR